ncbi:MAG: helix-turn-helix transcriptional regulator [Clostridiales bacterium]
MNKKFGDQLKDLRIENNLTQKDIAEKFNTGKSTISNYETNNRLPDINVIAKYAEFFGVSIDYMMGNSDQRVLNLPQNNKDYQPSQDEKTFFSDRLKNLMLNKDFTAKDLSIQLSISKDEVLSYVMAINFPNTSIIKKIAIALNTSTDYLLGIIDNPNLNSDNLILPDYIEIAKSAQNNEIPAKELSDFIKKYKTKSSDK